MIKLIARVLRKFLALTRPLFLWNPVRVFYVGLSQGRSLARNHPPGCRRLIVFLTYPYDTVTGGVLSLVSLHEETAKLRKIHGAEVLLCTLPGDPPLLKYTKFKNQAQVYPLNGVLRHFGNAESLMVHIPEYAVGKFLETCSPSKLPCLGKIKDLRLNVLLQNIDMMAFGEPVKRLGEMGKVTATTVHRSYTTPAVRKKFGYPIQRFSVFVSPEQYARKSYASKENLMIVSPDPHLRKKEILAKISETLPGLGLLVIENMTYEKYKAAVSRAKWALTFGEGLDNYLVEPAFSGGIGFSVFNPRFFTREFKGLRTIYPDYDSLHASICGDIMKLDNPRSYSDYQDILFKQCAKHYDFREYQANLLRFYQKYFPAVK